MNIKGIKLLNNVDEIKCMLASGVKKKVIYQKYKCAYGTFNKFLKTKLKELESQD